MNNIAKFLFVLFFSATLFSQTFHTYNVNYKFWLSSAGAYRFGLYGFDNPANLTYAKNFDLYFLWKQNKSTQFSFEDFGIFTGVKNLGFGFVNQKLDELTTLKTYRISSSFGNKSLSLGVAYSWSNSNNEEIKVSNLWTLGSLIRPVKYISIGLVGFTDFKDNFYEGVVDFALRPFGNEKLALFSDFTYTNSNRNSYNKWSAGLVIEPLPGIQVTGRYFDTKYFNFGIQLSLGNFGIINSNKFDKDLKNQETIYGIRIGAYDRNILSKIIRAKNEYKIDLNGQIKYQKSQLFDNSKTLISIIRKLENIKNDSSINRVILNTSGIAASKIFLWEIREKLKELRNSGKEIYIYIDNANIDLYHFASVANKIVLDPMGTIILEGFVLGRNYYKGTLDKLGIGFEELRYFKYKSAAETFSRESMSEADREQRQALIDNLYNFIKNDISQDRTNLTIPFDTLINQYVLFTANEAKEIGLVDSIARWYEISSPNSTEKGMFKLSISNKIETEELPEDNYWGEKPKIAVIYGLGACAMDEGITARKLVRDFDRVLKDNSIKAVVFRVDSPGGDALASDVIAEAMKKLKKIKPLIVSQGYVAGSGGYWLSMYADTIVSMPTSITGSIGVIGSWFYNKGLKENFGVSTDLVKKGDHADLGFGFIIPLLNLSIPDRNLTQEEKSKFESMIKIMYKEFVNKVALGRGKTPKEIEDVAQGRVWSGIDAKNIGLVDVLGGLETAIEIARLKAGLNKNEFEIVEFPKPQLFDLSYLLPFNIKTRQIEHDPLSMLKFRIRNNGKAMLLMPLDTIEEENYLFSINY